MTKDELHVIVGRNIKRYRNDRNMTQDELSEQVHISTSFCANIERGAKGMDLLVLRNIADALQVTTDSLLYENRSESQIDNLALVLRNKPESYIMKIEAIARMFADERDSTTMQEGEQNGVK